MDRRSSRAKGKRPMDDRCLLAAGVQRGVQPPEAGSTIKTTSVTPEIQHAYADWSAMMEEKNRRHGQVWSQELPGGNSTTNSTTHHQRSVSSSSAEENDDQLGEADAALLLGPVISKTQSAGGFYASSSGPGSAKANVEEEDIEEESGEEAFRGKEPLSVPASSTSPTSPTSPTYVSATAKEQKMGVMSFAAQKLSTISGIGLPLRVGVGSGPETPDGVGGGSASAAPKQAGKRSLLFPSFTLPTFTFPQLPSAPAFLSEVKSTASETRKRARTIVLSRERASKISNQSPGPSIPFFNKPSATATAPAGGAFIPPTRQRTLRRSCSHPSLLSFTSSIDNARFGTVQSMTNSRLKALKDNFRGSSAGTTIANAASMLSSYASSLNTVLGTASSMATPGVGPSTAASNGAVPAAPTIKPHPLDLVEGDIVVLGGYRGSILRETKAARRRVWIPLKVGLNLRKVNLEIGLNPEDEENMAEKIVPDGMLTHIGPVDIGKRLIKRLRMGEREQSADGTSLGRRVHNWGYDWRLSPALLSKQFIQFLETLPCNLHEGKGMGRGKGRGALVIAHSLGGLVTRHAINQRPELFSGVLFAGTPQHCVNILGPLRNGDTVLLSSKVLSAQVNFTIRSSFALLPLEGHCFVDKKTGEKYPVDFFEVNTWIRYGLSPCVSQPQPAPPVQRPGSSAAMLTEGVKRDSWKDRAQMSLVDSTQGSVVGGLGASLSPFSPMPAAWEQRVCTLPLAETIPYLERTLRETKRFKEELAFRPEIGYVDGENEGKGQSAVWESGEQKPTRVGYPPMAILYGKNTPTVKGAKIDGMESIILDSVYEDLIFGAGDGVCLAKAAQLPPGYRACRRVLTDRGHISLLGDLDAVGRAVEGIVTERGW